MYLAAREALPRDSIKRIANSCNQSSLGAIGPLKEFTIRTRHLVAAWMSLTLTLTRWKLQTAREHCSLLVPL